MVDADDVAEAVVDVEPVRLPVLTPEEQELLIETASRGLCASR